MEKKAHWLKKIRKGKKKFKKQNHILRKLGKQWVVKKKHKILEAKRGQSKNEQLLNNLEK